MKPKTLYRYNFFHELEKHHLENDDVPQIISDTSEGTIWRVRSEKVDFSGWEMLKQAKRECIINIRVDIHRLQELLKEMNK